MNRNLTSLTLSAQTVQAILTAYLNTHILRTPHAVTGIELLDMDCIMTLEPAPEAEAESDSPTWYYPHAPERVITTTVPVEYRASAPANGNGHHVVGAESPSPAPAPETTPAAPGIPGGDAPEAPKSRKKRISALTPELRAAILARHAAGIGPTAIAAELNVGTSTAARVIAQARRDGAA